LFPPPRLDGLWGPQSLLSNGYLCLHPGVKRPGREAEHSPPPSTEVKDAWRYTYNLQYVFMGWYLIKQWIRLHSVVLS